MPNVKVPLVGPIYVAHPYTESPAENRKLAAFMSRMLNFAGFLTVSPLQELRHVEGSGVPEISYRDAMYHCCAMIDHCLAVVFPENFRESPGCLVEYTHANRIGKPVFITELSSVLTRSNAYTYEHDVSVYMPECLLELWRQHAVRSIMMTHGFREGGAEPASLIASTIGLPVERVIDDLKQLESSGVVERRVSGKREQAWGLADEYLYPYRNDDPYDL